MVEGQVLEKRRKTGLRGGSKSQKQDSTRSELYSVLEEDNKDNMDEGFRNKEKVSGVSDASGARDNDINSDDELCDEGRRRERERESE